MSIVGLRCKRGYRTFAECISECPSRCVTAPAVMDQMAKNSEENGYYQHREREYHVTSLIGCPRRLVLARIFGDYARPLNIWKITVGTLGHELMERYPTKPGKAEQQLDASFDIDGEPCKVVGKFDYFDFNTEFINDYKFVWSKNYMPSDNHFRQMACYEAIARKMMNVPQWSKGFEIIYVYVPEGMEYHYIADGEKFKYLVSELEQSIPVMLGNYISGERDGIVPVGDKKYKQCAYCAPEFKHVCNAAAPNDVETLRTIIDKYRKEHTPDDNNE